MRENNCANVLDYGNAVFMPKDFAGVFNFPTNTYLY